MLLLLDSSITTFVASVRVVQAGEEIVNRIAMEKFGFSLEKFGSLKDYCKLIASWGYCLSVRTSACKRRCFEYTTAMI